MHADVFWDLKICMLRRRSLASLARAYKLYVVHAFFLSVHFKNTRVSRDPEKGPLGPNSIPGQRWPGNQSNWQIMGSDWPSCGSYFASSWLISGSSLTRNGVWPQWTLFRVTLTRVFLECTFGGLAPPPPPPPIPKSWLRYCLNGIVRSPTCWKRLT